MVYRISFCLSSGKPCHSGPPVRDADLNAPVFGMRTVSRRSASRFPSEQIIGLNKRRRTRGARPALPRPTSHKSEKRGYANESKAQLIVSSARDSSAGGRVRPSAFAVFKLIISPNLVG
jgi:hypothetical protein